MSAEEDVEVGEIVLLKDGRSVTVTERLTGPHPVSTPKVQYTVDVGGGWTTRVWPQDIVRRLSKDYEAAADEWLASEDAVLWESVTGDGLDDTETTEETT